MKTATRNPVHAGQGVPARFLSANSGGTPSWFGVVHLYSPAALTDASGAVVERYAYTAYGAQTIMAPGGEVRARSGVGFDRGFTGHLVDEEVELYYARTRYYSGFHGVFLNRNPWSRTQAMVIWPYHHDLIPGGWAVILSDGMSRAIASSYMQNRWLLYAYADGNVVNYLEPFSGRACLVAILDNTAETLVDGLGEVGRVPPGIGEAVKLLDSDLVKQVMDIDIASRIREATTKAVQTGDMSELNRLRDIQRWIQEALREKEKESCKKK